MEIQFLDLLVKDGRKKAIDFSRDIEPIKFEGEVIRAIKPVKVEVQVVSR